MSYKEMPQQKRSVAVFNEMRLEDLSREIRVGVEAFERGEVRDFDESLAEEIHQRGLARTKQRQGHE
jgi:hypothetical protein